MLKLFAMWVWLNGNTHCEDEDKEDVDPCIKDATLFSLGLSDLPDKYKCNVLDFEEPSV